MEIQIDQIVRTFNELEFELENVQLAETENGELLIRDDENSIQKISYDSNGNVEVQEMEESMLDNWSSYSGIRIAEQQRQIQD